MKIVQLLLVLVLLAGPARLQATNPKVDSLLRVLQTHTTADRAEVLWGIAYELFDIDNGQAVFYAERAYHEVWKRGDSLQIVKVGTTYGQLLRRVGKVDRSIEVSSGLLPIAKRHDYRKYTKMLLNSLGLAHMFKEKYDKALEFNYESLALREEDGDSIEMSVVLGNIGLIHYKLSDHKLAIKHSNKALDFSGQNVSVKVNAYTTIGSSYLEMEQYELANSNFRIALEYDKSTPDLGYRAKILYGIASSQFLSNKFDSAEYYANLSCFFAEKLSDKWSMTLSKLVLSKIAIQRNRIDESSRFLSTADSISLSSDYPYLRLEVLRQKARHLAKCGHYDVALKILEDHEALRDSLFHGENDPRIRKIQIAFAQRENERKISAQASILALKNDALAKHRILTLVISCLLVVVIILAVELYRANQKKQKVNQLLDVRVAERTRELGLQRDALQHRMAEQKMIKAKVGGELMSHLSTLQGLVHLLRLDQPRNAELYFSKAEEVAAQMTYVVNRYLADGAKIDQ